MRGPRAWKSQSRSAHPLPDEEVVAWVQAIRSTGLVGEEAGLELDVQVERRVCRGSRILMEYDEAGARRNARPRTSCEERVIAVLCLGSSDRRYTRCAKHGRRWRQASSVRPCSILSRRSTADAQTITWVSRLWTKRASLDRPTSEPKVWCAFCIGGRQSLRCATRTGDDHEIAKPCRGPCVFVRLLSCVGGRGYRFENWFRTGQRKHKAFRPATPITPGA